VHLAKGCFTGQEALQRLITYESVRRRPVHVRLGGDAPQAGPVAVPADVLAHAQPVGALTSVFGSDGLVVVRREAIERSDPLTLADGTPLVVVSAPEPARPLGRA
jgi:folate-binding Fe-S cluster repair protein YgfZ